MKRPFSETFRKRKETLKRKAKELSTLCDIPVCAVIVSPKGKTESWPESRGEVETIFDMYKEKARNLDHHGRDPAKNNVQRTENDDELMQCLNSKIAAVENRFRVLKKINGKKIKKEASGGGFDEIGNQNSAVVAL